MTAGGPGTRASGCGETAKRRRFSRRVFVAGAGALAFAPLLSACGADNAATPSTLRVHLRLSAYERAAFERVILPTFQREHNLRVVWEDGTVDEAIGRLGDPQAGIDLIAVDTERLGALIAASLVQPLDSQREALAAPPWQAMLPALELGGTLYALPYRPTTWIAYYNRTLLDASRLAPPPTWDAALATADRLREGGGAAQLSLQGAAGEPAARSLAELIWAHGGDPLEPTGAGAQAAGALLAQLGPLLSPLAREASFGSMTTALGTGQVALGPNWPSVAADLLQRGGQRDIATYAGPVGPRGGPRLLSGQVLVMPRYAVNRDGGALLAAYLRAPATQTILARELAWLPTSEQAVAAVPEWQREVATVAFAALRDARTLPPLAQREVFDAALGEAFRAIAFERQVPGMALARAGERVREVR